MWRSEKHAYLILLKSLPALVMLLLSYASGAQEKQITHSDQQWFRYELGLRFAEKWAMETDVGFRVQEQFSEPEKHVLRSGLSYAINPNVRVLLGFGHFGSYNMDGLSKIEHRPYHQTNIDHEYGKVEAGHRFRAEGRYFVSRVGDDPLFYFRFRYRFRLNIPLLVKLTGEKPEKKLLLSISDEILINAGREIVYNVFDENRIGVGLVGRFNEQWSVNASYNHFFGSTSVPAAFEQSHVFQFGVKHDLNLAGN